VNLKGYVRRSFGPTAKIRVKRILEALLVFAVEDPKGELHSTSGDMGLQVSLNNQQNQLIVKATTKQIADLANQYEKRLRKQYLDKVSTWHVVYAFEHFQKTLKIFEDLRVRKQGSEVWTFRLTLWHSIDEHRKNLDEVDLRLKKPGGEDSTDGIAKNSQKSQQIKRWWERDLQPLNFTPFFAEKRQYFIGREWIFDEIDVRCVLGNEQALIITGDPGSGKSAFISEFVYRNPQRVIAYHSCHADIEQTIKPGRFVRSIAGMLARRLDAYATVLSDPSFREGLDEKSCETDPAGSFEFGVLNPLHSLEPPPKDIQFILIDGLDAVISSGEFSIGQSIVHLLAARLQRLPQWLRIIATSRKETQTLLRLSRQGLVVQKSKI
jgi:Effector-associated domain 4